MTRVDFYILQGDQASNRELFACRLAEKAYRLGNKVYIHTGNPQQAAALDTMLWTFKQNSFIPHSIEGQSPDEHVAVLIGHSPELQDQNHAHTREVLINLAQEIPLFFSSFERVTEVVDQNTQNKSSGRDRYRFYRDRGYPLSNHNIN